MSRGHAFDASAEGAVSAGRRLLRHERSSGGHGRAGDGRVLCPAEMVDPGAATNDAYVPTIEDVRANAAVACDEIRRQIGLQAADAAAIDVKSSAVFTLSLALVGVSAARIHVDSGLGVVATALALLAGIALAWSCRQALRPRSGFSYGADAQTLVGTVETYAPYGVMVRLAQSLASARDLNANYLGVKQQWYERALTSLIAVGFSLALMVQVGAIR